METRHGTSNDLIYARNVMSGWGFTEADIKEALSRKRLLNPSIDLSNPCNLNCPYCFIEEKDSERKLRCPDELSIDEILRVVCDFASAGAKTVNIVGAGEPTIDPVFGRLLEEISAQHMTPVVFTNGIHLGERPGLVDLLYETGSTVVLKYNSSNSRIQDLVAGRWGYSALRDRAIDALLNRGFNSHQPTRLAFDVVAFRGILGEIPDLYRECRRKNIFPIVADFIPTGRTEDGEFVGEAALRTLPAEDRNEVVRLLKPLGDAERVTLYAKLRGIDREEFGVYHHTSPAYYSGAPCVQILGVYVDIHGSVWPCVAREMCIDGHVIKNRLGTIRGGDLPSVLWRESTSIGTLMQTYTGACPYKKPLGSGISRDGANVCCLSLDGP